MPEIRIVNCHIHTFTARHVPVDYPYWFLRPFKVFPALIRGLAAIASLIGQDRIADKLSRLYRFQKETQAGAQRRILDNIRLHYPENTRFVVLPMDLSQIGFGAPPVPLKDQHDELSALNRDPDVGKAVIPFATIDPRSDPAATELWRAIDELNFKGVKIYPRLGFAPDDPVLMTKVYPGMVERNLPLMTHCSRGGVQGRGVSDHAADRFTEPSAYVPVMLHHPDLKICLAHFGGQVDWRAYVNPAEHDITDEMFERNWQVSIRRLICSGKWPGLWTDISYTLFHFEDYIPFLRLFLTGDDLEAERLRRRVLFGSDFYMTRQEKLSEKAVCFRLRNALGDEVFRQISEINPRIWLGELPEPPRV